MEVRINKEVREYTEAVFFGLNIRQLIFSGLACGVAVGIYFGLREPLGTEIVSWMCILGAAPFAALGFITYHGMTAEKALWAWIKSELLIPKKLVSKPTNAYYEAFNDTFKQKQKEALKSNENTQTNYKEG